MELCASRNFVDWATANPRICTGSSVAVPWIRALGTYHRVEILREILEPLEKRPQLELFAVQKNVHNSEGGARVVAISFKSSNGWEQPKICSTSVGWRTTVEHLPRSRRRRRNLPLDARLSAN